MGLSIARLLEYGTPIYVFMMWSIVVILLARALSQMKADLVKPLPLGLFPLSELRKQKDPAMRLLLTTSLFEFVMMRLQRDASMQEKLLKYYQHDDKELIDADALIAAINNLLPIFRSVSESNIRFALAVRNDIEHAETKRMSISVPSCDPPLYSIENAADNLTSAIRDTVHLLPSILEQAVVGRELLGLLLLDLYRNPFHFFLLSVALIFTFYFYGLFGLILFFLFGFLFTLIQLRFVSTLVTGAFAVFVCVFRGM